MGAPWAHGFYKYGNFFLPKKESAVSGYECLRSGTLSSGIMKISVSSSG